MPDLRRYIKGWNDPRWAAAVQKLPSNQKFALEQSLTGLLEALKECKHPRLDAKLQAWLPSRWDAPRDVATRGEFVEYRLGDRDNRARVIVCFDQKEKVIYLVARTVIHDHAALRELVASFK